MASVSRYNQLQKQNTDNTFSFFQPLRAIGLAVEEGHKAAKKYGLGLLTVRMCSEVRVTGALKVLDETGKWRRVRRSVEIPKCPIGRSSLEVTLQRRPADSPSTSTAKVFGCLHNITVTSVSARPMCVEFMMVQRK